MIDEVLDILSDGWEALLESLSYIFTGELFSDIPEFFGSMFENISEFSILGVGFGLIAFLTIFFLRDYMLEPFLKFYSPTGRIFWGAVTYIGCFMAGYLLGKHFENTG